jgi:hypothetical protein
MMKTNYAIIVYRLPDGEDGDMDVLHICCYEEKPTDFDSKSLMDEIMTDEEFGLTEFTDLKMLLIDRESANELFDRLDIPKIINE